MFIESCCVPNIILGVGDRVVNKAAKTPALMDLIFWWWITDDKQRNKCTVNKCL